jgi:hypothetical protein
VAASENERKKMPPPEAEFQRTMKSRLDNRFISILTRILYRGVFAVHRRVSRSKRGTGFAGRSDRLRLSGGGSVPLVSGGEPFSFALVPCIAPPVRRHFSSIADDRTIPFAYPRRASKVMVYRP